MKKLLFLLLLLGVQATNFACNLCVGYDGDRLLRKRAPHFVTCNCNCYAQGISKHVDGHKCVKCGHRVMPYTIKDKKKKVKKDANPWTARTLQRYQEPPAQQSKIDLGKMFLVDQLD